MDHKGNDERKYFEMNDSGKCLISSMDHKLKVTDLKGNLQIKKIYIMNNYCKKLGKKT